MQTRVASIYKEIGLTKLDTFIQTQVTLNQQQLTQRRTRHFEMMDLYRQIGSTTWMCTRGVLELLACRNIFLVAPTVTQADSLVKTTMGLFHRATPNVDWAIKRTDKLVQVGTSFIRWGWGHWGMGPSPTGLVHDKGLVLDDDVWKLRAIRRHQGPYAMIREIRWEQGHYRAYAEDDEQLMELHPDALAEMDTTKVRFVGFNLIYNGKTASILPDVPAVRAAKVSPMRGPLSMSGTATLNKRWQNMNFDQEFQGKWIGKRSTV